MCLTRFLHVGEIVEFVGAAIQHCFLFRYVPSHQGWPLSSSCAVWDADPHLSSNTPLSISISFASFTTQSSSSRALVSRTISTGAEEENNKIPIFMCVLLMTISVLWYWGIQFINKQANPYDNYRSRQLQFLLAGLLVSIPSSVLHDYLFFFDLFFKMEV